VARIHPPCCCDARPFTHIALLLARCRTCEAGGGGGEEGGLVAAIQLEAVRSARSGPAHPWHLNLSAKALDCECDHAVSTLFSMVYMRPERVALQRRGL